MTTAEVEAAIRGQLIDQLEVAVRGILTALGHNPDDDVTRGIVVLHFRRAMGRPDPAPARPSEPVHPSLAPPLTPADS